AWLPSFIAGDTGIPISSRMQSFLLTPNHPNELKPGKRPRITLSPTLVLKDGQPFAALSTPGGDNQDQALLQALFNVIEFGMNPQEAVEAARFETAHFVSSFADHSFNPGSLSLEKRFGDQVAEEMKRRGHKVTMNDNFAPTSAPTIVIYDPKTRLIQAGADARRGRYAMGGGRGSLNERRPDLTPAFRFFLPRAVSTCLTWELQMMVTLVRMWSRPVIGLDVFLACFTSGDPGLSASQNASAKIDPKLFQGLRYRSIGPHRGGRVTAVAGHRRQPHTFYMGATGGGVWKTTDAGQNWENISDGYFETASIGA